MRSIGAYEAKTNLSKILKRVSKGGSVSITRHGAPLAFIIPATKTTEKSVEETIQALHNFSKKHSLGRLKLKKLISTGRK